MEQKKVKLDLETFSCLICLDLMKDPVTIPCGHSYCMNCIKANWDVQGRRKSCPQCRKTFTQRPDLVKNIMLANMVEELKKTQLQADPCYAGPDDAACDVCSGRRLKALKFCLVCSVYYCEKHLQPHHDSPAFDKHRLVDSCLAMELEVRRVKIQQRIQDKEKDVKLLQQEVEAINGSADKAVEDSEKMFTDLVRLIQKRSSDVKHKVRSQQETEVSRVKELQEKLEQEIAELEQLSHTEDHIQFLHNHPSMWESTHSSSINSRSLKYFEDVTAAVSETRDELQDILREKWTKMSLTVTEEDVLLSDPSDRFYFLSYARHLTLDPNTANTLLLLSKGNRKATITEEEQPYCIHPDRFSWLEQVLSKESLTECCYWEVEWREQVSVAVAYKNIRRDGPSDDSVFGYNDKSWSLFCCRYFYQFVHNRVEIKFSGPRSSRVGVYLDHSAGILSFYSVSETMTLLHRVQTTFTQPLYAGFQLFEPDSDNVVISAKFASMKSIKKIKS